MYVLCIFGAVNTQGFLGGFLNIFMRHLHSFTEHRMQACSMNSSRIKIDVFWMTRHYYLKTTARAKNSAAADPHSMPRFPEALFLRGERIKDS